MKLPRGTIIDGELVVMRGGGPDFYAHMQRDVCRRPDRVAHLAAAMPATFVAFDLLYHRHKSVMALPLVKRRKRLDDTFAKLGNSDWLAPARAGFYNVTIWARLKHLATI